jgi:transcriptional regulator with XRE-family HTH domain
MNNENKNFIIRALVTEGKTYSDVAQKIGVSPQYIQALLRDYSFMDNVDYVMDAKKARLKISIHQGQILREILGKNPTMEEFDKYAKANPLRSTHIGEAFKGWANFLEKCKSKNSAT